MQIPAEFSPHRLLVYLSNRCGMACSYCFSARSPRTDRSPAVEPAAVAAAARLVAANAARRGVPMELLLHGGGEPTLHWDLLLRLRDEAARAAAGAGAGFCSFVATSGILSARRAAELGRRFEVIGLSCDGPPDIQDCQRPLGGGAPSSQVLERTAAVLADSPARVSVRTTITPKTVGRQAEIVAYLNQDLGVSDMRFHPVYEVGGAGQFLPGDAERFVANFLDAAEEARARGCRLSYSGMRREEQHGPYCDTLSDILHLLPDNSATACFFAVGPEAAGKRIGGWDPATARFHFDPALVEAHRARAAAVPARCANCAAVRNCARECPERCAALAEWHTAQPGFRCRVAQILAARLS